MRIIFLYFSFLYFSLYEESAESIHLLADKLPAPGNAIETKYLCDKIILLLKAPLRQLVCLLLIKMLWYKAKIWEDPLARKNYLIACSFA